MITTINEFRNLNIAQNIHASANEGDIFRVTFTNPSTQGHHSGTEGNTFTSQSELVKVGDYFVEKEDLNKPDEGSEILRKRKYLPSNLDKTNKSLTFINIGNINH